MGTIHWLLLVSNYHSPKQLLQIRNPSPFIEQVSQLVTAYPHALGTQVVVDWAGSYSLSP